MKHRKLLPLTVAISLCGAAVFAHSVRAAERERVVEGEITQMTNELVTVDGIHSFKFEPAKAQCFDFRADKTTCETLVLTGYAAKARVTVLGDVVQRIDLIEVLQ